MNAADRLVYIVAPDPLARGGLVALLEQASGWAILGHASPEAAAQWLLQDTSPIPDLLLWDCARQALEHLPILVGILEEQPGIAALALLDNLKDEYLTDEDLTDMNALRAVGVNGFLTRTFAPETLFAAMDAVAAGLIVFEPELFSNLDLAARATRSIIDDTTTPTTLPLPHPLPLPDPLTPREMDVLRLVAEGLPNKTIARELAISEHTVKFHMNSILGKLNAQSRTEAVINAGRAGIIQV